MAPAHLSLKAGDQAPQPTQLPDRFSLHRSPSKVDTAATQLTSNSKSTTARLALMVVSAVLAVTKRQAKAIKAANMEATKLSAAITMAITSNAVDGVATTEDIK
jgi:hypothetical protein